MKVALSFLNSLFRDRTYDGLTWLSTMICESTAFAPADADYGLPEPLLVVVEGLNWFAQGARSGSITYFEATPSARQQAMLAALKARMPGEFADQYEVGMRRWREPDGAALIDQWIDHADEQNTALLWELATANRAEIERLIAR